jgi:glycosyltransferase
VKLSIITAVFNCRGTVADTLSSVTEQDYENVEHIVIDGASSDGTTDVLNRYRAKLDVLVSEKDNGIYDALNKGIGLATGDVVGFLHADDVLSHPQVLSRIAAAFADPAVDAVYGDLDYVDKDNPDHLIRQWRAGRFNRNKLAWGWMPPHPTFYVRRSVYQRLGGFDTRYRIAADYEMILRLLGKGGIQPTYIPEVLIKMRTGGTSNRSLRNIIQKSTEDLRALKSNGVGSLGALVWKNVSKLGQYMR